MPIPPEPITSMTAYFPIFCIRGSELFKPLLGYLRWTRAGYQGWRLIHKAKWAWFGAVIVEFKRSTAGIFQETMVNASVPARYPLFA